MSAECCNFSKLKFHEVLQPTQVDTETCLKPKPIKKFRLGNSSEFFTEDEAHSVLLKKHYPEMNFEDGQQKEILF